MMSNKLANFTLLPSCKRFNLLAFSNISVRCMATHWDPKFKKLRKEKFIKIELPDFDKIRKTDETTETAEERRARMIKEGIEPTISFEYKPINISSSSILCSI